MTYDIEKIRHDFPILSKEVYYKPLIYLDNAASAQKPQVVIDAINDYYQNNHANIHRALHYLGEVATLAYEEAREKAHKYINSKSSKEIIFTKGTTESINLITTSLSRAGWFKKDEEIILTVMEHHSNIVPWQILAETLGMTIRVVSVFDNGELDLEQLYGLLNEKTRVLAISHVSNSLGTINPIKDIVSKVKKYNSDILIAVDGAQALPNLTVDVQDLDCDFYSFSSHKVYGPTGVGVLYGKEKLLEKLPPYQGGGEMINQVILPFGTTYAELPHKFEAGTPNIADVIGFGVALDYLKAINWVDAKEYKNKLLTYCTQQLQTIENLVIYGSAANKVAVVSFVIKNLNGQDVGLLLDQHGIAVRTGHHCNMPLMSHFNINGTIRASFGLYNTINEIDIFVSSLKQVIKILSK